MSRLYLDHAATTPCRAEVWDAMRPYFVSEYGNPNSIHAVGREAREAVEGSRKKIACCLGCGPQEVVLTSGGSESNNLALRGVLRGRKGHLVTTRIEHHSVLRTCQDLQRRGVHITYLDVDEFGHVHPEEVVRALRDDTILVSIMHANNEFGTIQDLAPIAGAIKARCPSVLVHTDAVQTVGHAEVNVQKLGVDLLSFTAHKFYGPKGIGGLYVREGVTLQPQITGGGQECGVRSGSESVPLIVGMAVALEFASEELHAEQAHWTPIRDRLIEGLLSQIPDSRLNGHPTQRLATNVNVSFLGVSGEDVVLRLDRLGVSASSASACTTGSVEPSHAVSAIGLQRAWALGALRLTLGHACRTLDVEQVVRAVRDTVAELRSTCFVPTKRTSGCSAAGRRISKTPLSARG